MIFFKEDWNHYPTAIVDSNTKNVSWVKYAHLLQKMGVSNYYFPLALIDPSLKGVDPFDPNISAEQAQRVLLECNNNVWYFLRELVRVPAKASPFPSMLEANRGNVALAFLALNDIDVGITQIRQTGKTLNCNILLSYVALIKCVNVTIQLMTRSGKLRSENVAALKDIRKLLPSYVGNISKKDSDNTEGLTYNLMNNKLITALPQADPDAATGAGRGFTSPIIMIDESAFCNNIQYSYPSMMSSSNAACDEARKHGMPTFKLFPCTAGDKGREEGKFMYDLYHGVARWREQFFDCKNKEELQEVVRTNSRNRRLMVYIEFNHRQLGKSDTWLYDKIVESGGSPDEVNRDYFNQWTSGSGNNPLAPELREAVSKSKTTPLWTETSADNYLINWYISKEDLAKRVNEDTKFVVGSDASEGIGRDQMTLVFIDEQTLETVATCSVCEIVNTIRFADFVSKTLIKYPNIVLIPERKSSGIVIIDHLLTQLPMNGIDPFYRIYNRIVSDDEVPASVREVMNIPFNRRTTRDYDKCKVYFGYATSSGGIHSRNNLYELTLPRMANYAADNVRDETLVSELMSLVVKNGRIDHAASGHDDNVVAWLLAGWLLNFGRNLSEYGIRNPLLKTSSYKDRNKIQHETVVQKHERSHQEQLRHQMGELIKQLAITEGDIDAIIIERKIKHLNNQINYTTKLPMSVDELVKEAHSVRKNKLLTSRHGGR